MHGDLKERIRAAAKCLVEQGATAVHVFGSAAKGTMRKDSDVDIAVRGLPASVFFRAMADASRIVGKEMDLIALEGDDAITRSIAASGELQRVD